MASSTASLAKHVLRLTRSSNVNFHRVRDKVVVLDGKPGHLKCEMKVEEEHCNCHGTLHGGLIATLLDDIGGTANVTALKNGSPDIPAFTVQNNINYLKPVHLGQTITISADVLQKGNTLAVVTVVFKNKNNETMAVGNTILQLGKPRNGMDYNMFDINAKL